MYGSLLVDFMSINTQIMLWYKTQFSLSHKICYLDIVRSMINSHHVFQRTPKFYKEVFLKERGNVPYRSYLILILLQNRVRLNISVHCSEKSMKLC